MTSFRATMALVVVIAAAALQAHAIPPPKTPPQVCVMPNGEGNIEQGKSGKSSDGCMTCNCEEGTRIMTCVSRACPPTPCHDSVKTPGVCCETCPNGPNCKTPGGALVSDGQSVTENNMYCMCSLQFWMPTGGSEGPQAVCIPLPPPPPSGCAFTNGTEVAGTKPGDDLQLDPCTTCFCTDGYVLQCVDEACPAPECSNYFTPQGQCCPQCP
ncbi:cysteine-rich motor neuron 1 protein-like [Littorina saxatilis]|uniref:VWFC domain-containing protein n=2 Tax=Littorina saxatilis TaxID=31220 RepID=A0AAN9FYZ9_9CAEN